MAVINWTDPCARASALRAAYFDLIRGAGETLIRHSTSEGDQEVRYRAGDVHTLRSELAQAEAECAALTGGLPPARARRFAIRGGARRDY